MRFFAWSQIARSRSVKRISCDRCLVLIPSWGGNYVYILGDLIVPYHCSRSYYSFLFFVRESIVAGSGSTPAEHAALESLFLILSGGMYPGIMACFRIQFMVRCLGSHTIGSDPVSNCLSIMRRPYVGRSGVTSDTHLTSGEAGLPRYPSYIGRGEKPLGRLCCVR